MIALIAYVLLIAALVLSGYKIVRELFSTESRALLRKDNQRWGNLLRGARQTFRAARRAYDRSAKHPSGGASGKERARQLFLDERPTEEEIVARMGGWNQNPDPRESGESDHQDFDADDPRLVSTAKSDQIIGDFSPMAAIFEEEASKQALPPSRRSLDLMFPAVGSTPEEFEPYFRDDDQEKPIRDSSVVIKASPSRKPHTAEQKRSVSPRDYLRLFFGYGSLSTPFGYGQLSAIVGAAFSTPFLGFLVWRTFWPDDPNLPTDRSLDMGAVMIPAGLLCLALVLVSWAYFRTISPRIEILLKGQPIPGRVEFISYSKLQRRNRRSLERIQWNSEDGTRSGVSFPVLPQIASRYEIGQEIWVYCDHRQESGGEIDVLLCLT